MSFANIDVLDPRVARYVVPLSVSVQDFDALF